MTKKTIRSVVTLKKEMTPKQLISKIKRLSDVDVQTEKFRKKLDVPNWNPRASYKNQKEHWLGWLSEVDGPGYYGRKKGHKAASSVYNRIMCEPMLFWLMEASGISKPQLKKVLNAALEAKPHCAARCPAMRKIVSWTMIEEALEKI